MSVCLAFGLSGQRRRPGGGGFPDHVHSPASGRLRRHQTSRHHNPYPTTAKHSKAEAGGVTVPLAVSHPRPELEYTIADSDATIVVAATGVVAGMRS